MARILFVDDDPFTLETLAKAVQIFGHEAIWASTGEQALTLAKNETPDLIFVDMMLPDIDGLTLVGLLHEEPVTTDIPLLVLSAGPELDATDRALAAGARAYLMKPIRLQALNSIIEEYTAKA